VEREWELESVPSLIVPCIAPWLEKFHANFCGTMGSTNGMHSSSWECSTRKIYTPM